MFTKSTCIKNVYNTKHFLVYITYEVSLFFFLEFSIEIAFEEDFISQKAW